VSDQNLNPDGPQTLPPPPPAKVTPTSMVSLGNISVLVTKVEQPNGQSGFFVNARRTSVPAGEDASCIPVSQIPVLIKLLEEIVTPAIQVRTFNTSAPEPAAPPARPSKKSSPKKRSKR